MRNLAEQRDTVSADPVSVRHRTVHAEAFPQPAAEIDYDAREAAYLRALLAGPLRDLARGAADAGSRATAAAALAAVDAAEGRIDSYGGLEDALAQIAATTSDDASRAIAEDALSLYRGR